MKKLLMATAMLAALVGTAQAEGLHTILRSGMWTTSWTHVAPGYPGESGLLMCVMTTTWRDGAALHVKYIQGDQGLRVHIYKPGWRFAPWEGSNVPVQIYFDRDLFGSYSAEGKMDHEYPLIKFAVDKPDASKFMAQFAEADWMWIKYSAGNEGAWSADMRGSRDAANAFQACITDIGGNNPTQPYDARPTPAPQVPDHEAEVKEWPRWLKR